MINFDANIYQNYTSFESTKINSGNIIPKLLNGIGTPIKCDKVGTMSI